MYRLVADVNATERLQNPRASANIFEILSFSWLLKLFKTGWKRNLNENDVYAILEEQKSSLLGSELEKRWRNELVEAKNANRDPRLLRVLLKMFAGQLLLSAFLQTINEMVFRNSRGILIGCLLAYFNPIGYKQIDKIYACIYAVALIFSMAATLVIGRYVHTEMEHCGMKMRVACCSIIFKKALRLSKLSLEVTTVGQVVNLTSNDVYRFDMALKCVHYLWMCPLGTILIAYLLWLEIGWSVFFGVSAVFIFIPLQGRMGKNISKFRSKIALRTDERVRLMNEIMSGIQVIKMYTWEKFFTKLVHNTRKQEIREIRSTLFRKLVLKSFRDFQIRLALLTTILVYIFLGHNIDTRKVFIMIAYYNIVKISSSALPVCIENLSEMFTSVDRIQKFLSYEEKHTQTSPQFLESKNIASSANNVNVSTCEKNSKTSIDNRKTSNGIDLLNVNAKWTDVQPENTLNDINLSVALGELVAIIGPVGAGKSSLIQAILGEIPLSGGSVSLRGVISYASQEPWLFNSSVRDNILFSSPMDKKRYLQVISVCALETDLLRLPYGDKTIVGDKGVSLSAGQRARINLARAVYRQADIYLLDDPLSAVDPNVAKQLFEKCIDGYLKNKTRVLVTHQLQYLTNVNRILLMEKANIIAVGSYQQLQSYRVDLFKSFGLSEETYDTKTSIEKINSSSLDNLNHVSTRQCTAQNVSVSSAEENNSNGIQKKLQPITVLETRTSGKVSLQDYLSYIIAGGSIFKLFSVAFITVFTQILCTSEEYWISYWVNLEDHVFRSANDERAFNGTTTTGETSNTSSLLLWWSVSHQLCLIIYVVLNGMILSAVLIRCTYHVSFFTEASMNLHNNMFNAITKAKMYFFNTNSSGRILNRFTKDMGLIDENLPALFTDVMAIGLLLIASTVLVGLIDVYLLIPTLCIGVTCCYVAVYILSTTRDIQRLEAVSRSPIFAHLNESLQGIITIRAFEAEKIVSRAFDDHQDSNSSIWYISLVSNQAFGFVIDLMCLIYLSILMFIFLVIQNYTSGGNIGLIITQTIGLIGNLQWGIRQCSQIENQMTSVERILEYTNLPQECALDSSPNKKPPKEWPNQGNIVFQKFSLRYTPDSPYILKDVNITIQSMEKVGIVGRTGAGKSSLINALFRLALNEGNIIIDGIEIHELLLDDLRSKLSIIPQEPVLFSGTMRKNLDPFDEYPDHVLWNALDEVQLKNVVENLSGGLNSKISEGGANFSVGQKQLVCLARAIVRNNKILILDEATANVDLMSDALIQNTIRNKFRSCTILIIAHRLNTIMDLEKVIVVDRGTVVEFDHPHNLLKNIDGFFYKMVDQTDRDMAVSLHAIAAESYKTLSTITDFPIVDTDLKAPKNE